MSLVQHERLMYLDSFLKENYPEEYGHGCEVEVAVRILKRRHDKFAEIQQKIEDIFADERTTKHSFATHETLSGVEDKIVEVIDNWRRDGDKRKKKKGLG